MKKNRFLLLLSFVSLLFNSCRNPFAKYADNYTNVIWSSTSASSLDIKLYILKENESILRSLCVVNEEENDYYLIGYIGDSLTIDEVDEYGIFNSDYFSIDTSKTYLRQGIYKSTIASISSDESKNFLNVKRGDYIELEMKKFNPEEEATPLMFSSVKYTSDSYNFVTYSKVRNTSNLGNGTWDNTFFVSYGTMNIDNKDIDVALKFLPDNKYFIFRNDNIEDIIFSGTYSNKWTDITLNFDVNKIDDTKSINIKAEFFSEL